MTLHADGTTPDGAETADDAGDLTQSLRKLVLPDAEQPLADATNAPRSRALLFCRDGSARKWGARWLEQYGFDAELHKDADDALQRARASDADVIIIEAAFRDADRQPVYEALVNGLDIDIPVIVLCPGSREMSAALDAGAYDVVRKPYEWRLISARARRAKQARLARLELNNAKLAASQALDLADSARQRLRSRESFEPVTGLPNKARFVELMKRSIGAVAQDGKRLAVFVIGFARFRLVIEAMGQERANLVLTEIGHKLNDCLQGVGTTRQQGGGLWTAAAASLDGARFGVMLTCPDDGDDLDAMQQRLLSTLSQPVQVASQIVHLSACVGVALYPLDGVDADRLLQRAENAMREAQGHGGGFRHYSEQSDAAAARKLRMEHLLHEALDKGEIEIAYQPIMGISSNRLEAAEALLRWPQADGSFISPNEFAPIAEESGMMIRLGEFVLDRACRELREWNDQHVRLPRICVNVSKVQLMSRDFVRTVAAVIERHGVDAGLIELEISERGVLSGANDIIRELHELRALGVRLSIDDFGTGDSAFSYLKEMPVDCLKIDRSYIGGMIDDKRDAAIVSAMVALGQRMELTVVAEGVESQEQLDMLRALDCHLYQGFIVSRPVAADKFAKFLNKSA